MKKDTILGIIFAIVIIVIAPFILIRWIPWVIKAYIRYISDKDKSSYSFSEHLTDVRHESKSFNRHWREMASRGIHVD